MTDIVVVLVKRSNKCTGYTGNTILILLELIDVKELANIASVSHVAIKLERLRLYYTGYTLP